MVTSPLNLVDLIFLTLLGLLVGSFLMAILGITFGHETPAIVRRFIRHVTDGYDTVCDLIKSLTR